MKQIYLLLLIAQICFSKSRPREGELVDVLMLTCVQTSPLSSRLKTPTASSLTHCLTLLKYGIYRLVLHVTRWGTYDVWRKDVWGNNSSPKVTTARAGLATTSIASMATTTAATATANATTAATAMSTTSMSTSILLFLLLSCLVFRWGYFEAKNIFSKTVFFFGSWITVTLRRKFPRGRFHRGFCAQVMGSALRWQRFPRALARQLRWKLGL